MSPRQKALLLTTLLIGVCCVFAAVAAAVWFRPAPVPFRVFDPKFRVLSVKVLKTSDERFYLGNPIEGRVRGFLRDRCHLKVKPVPEMSRGARSLSGSNGCTFIIQYSCEAAPSTTVMSAELVDRSGSALGIGNWWTYGTNCFFCNLDRERTNGGDYTLKLKRDSVCLAEFDLQRLPPVSAQRVYLRGEVGRGGHYPWVQGITLMDLVEAAGGFRPYASDEIRIEHQDGTKELHHYEGMRKRGKNDPLLRPGDKIWVGIAP